jgi:hypothetical protein
MSDLEKGYKDEVLFRLETLLNDNKELSNKIKKWNIEELNKKVDKIVDCLINDDELTEHLWSVIDYYLEEVNE